MDIPVIMGPGSRPLRGPGSSPGQALGRDDRQTSPLIARGRRSRESDRPP
jgi:hypothetical protein